MTHTDTRHPARYPAAVLDHAADLIDQRGWATQNYRGPNGSLCALGAIAVAADLEPHDWVQITQASLTGEMRADYPLYKAARAAADQLAREVNGESPDDTQLLIFCIGDWNDRQSSETVIATLRQAAEKARSA